MKVMTVPLAKFRCGRIVTTPNALSRLTQGEILIGIQRHQAGDWGDLYEHERHANNQALVEETRIWSAYHSTRGIKFWIITEADRSETTILLADDTSAKASVALWRRKVASFEREKSGSVQTNVSAVGQNGSATKIPDHRTLKVEEDGDFFQKKIKPKIRLKGYWLERAGFKPGNQVNVKCVAPGILELRAREDFDRSEIVNPF